MEKSGFVVQGALGTRRNDPPTVTCAVAKASILQGDTTTVRASAVDPDGDRSDLFLECFRWKD